MVRRAEGSAKAKEARRCWTTRAPWQAAGVTDRPVPDRDEADEDYLRRLRPIAADAFRDFDEHTASWAQAEVDVRSGGETDDELDDHLWLRLSARCPSNADVRALPDDLRAYYVSRLLEWSLAMDGPSVFFTDHPELCDLVAPAYHCLGLDEAATAYERFADTTAARRLLEDGTHELSADEHAELVAGWQAIGEHDAERIAFVRDRPDGFSI
jgi:hypothetical protein